VSRRRVVGVARNVGLGLVGIPEGDGAGEYDAPVRALAAVVGQPAEELRGVNVGPVGLEADRVTVEVDVATFHLRDVDAKRRDALVRVRHGNLRLSRCSHH
jgi:hypothetical protein